MKLISTELQDGSRPGQATVWFHLEGDTYDFANKSGRDHVRRFVNRSPLPEGSATGEVAGIRPLGGITVEVTGCVFLHSADLDEVDSHLSTWANNKEHYHART